MSWVATAVVGSAVIGGVASSKASGKAVDAAERGQDILAESRAQGRADVMAQFPKAQESQTRGFEEFRDFLSNQVAPQQATPFIGGNMAAQEQVARGLPQIQNAILGNPIDTSGFTARQIGQAPSFDVAKYRTPAPTVTTVPKFDFSNINIGSLGSGVFDPYRPIGGGVGNRFAGMNVKRNISI